MSHWHREIAAAALSLALLLAPCVQAFAAKPLADDKADLTQEIVLRCMHEIGEFGNDAVQMCIESETTAAEALKAYPAKSRPIIDRCLDRAWARGYQTVRLCADRDIEAATALDDYAKEHAPTIEACVGKVGGSGAAEVKSCVDVAIAQGGTAKRP
jgi:hypothetical protein